MHDRGYRIRGCGAHLRFSRPNGQPIPRAGNPTKGSTTVLINQNQLVPDDPLTPPWGGERLDPTVILGRLLAGPTGEAA